MKMLITGSSGLIGSALIPFLEKKKKEVYRLVRSGESLLTNEILWDLQRGKIDPSLLEGMDVVIHLAGENVMGRWSKAKKERIRESRIKGTQLLCQALCQLERPPSTLICASAIGYYGDRGDEILTEQSGKGKGFLADLCEEWEQATRSVVQQGVRVVHLRLGMVLSSQGGVFKKMLPLFKWGLGGKIGSGSQYVSWIAIDDLLSMIEYAIDQEWLAGPLNAVSPSPVTNAEWTRTWGDLLHCPLFFFMPSFMVKVIFGESGEELLLSSQRVQPKKLQEHGFQFQYPHLKEALWGLYTLIEQV